MRGLPFFVLLFGFLAIGYLINRHDLSGASVVGMFGLLIFSFFGTAFLCDDSQDKDDLENGPKSKKQ